MNQKPETADLLSDESLDRLDELGAEATPLPWWSEAYQPDVMVCHAGGVVAEVSTRAPGGRGIFDADFIVAACTLARPLAAEVRRLRAELTREREAFRVEVERVIAERDQVRARNRELRREIERSRGER